MQNSSDRRTIRWKSFDRPDETRPFPHGIGTFVDLDSLAIGRAVLEPGWRWSTDLKPLVGTELCELHHLHVLVSGRMAFETAGGEQHEFAPNDVMDIAPGHDAWVVGDEPVVVLDISGNVSDFGLPTSPTRAVATMLMTDIVGSTKMASELGDAVWKQRLAEHNRAVRRQLERFRGREIDTTGDGFLAIFESAGAAVLCALAAADATRALGMEIRAGVHKGEIELLPNESEASPSTRRPASWPLPNRPRSSSRRSRAPWRKEVASGSRAGDRTRSRALRHRWSCSQWCMPQRSDPRLRVNYVMTRAG